MQETTCRGWFSWKGPTHPLDIWRGARRRPAGFVRLVRIPQVLAPGFLAFLLLLIEVKRLAEALFREGKGPALGGEPTHSQILTIASWLGVSIKKHFTAL